MKKLFKALFSRLTAFGLLFLLQMVLLILFFGSLNYLFFPFQIAMWVLAIITLASIGFRKMPAETKTSWTVFVLLAPFFGTLAYLLFSQNRLRRKEAKQVKKIKEQIKIHNKREDNYKYNVGQVLNADQISQLEYIYQSNHLKSFTHSRLKFYPYGQDFYKDYIEDLKKAKKFIFIEYFIIAPGMMLDAVLDILKEKVKEGVEVRLLYDDMGSIGRTKSSFAKKMRKIGIKCYRFNPLKPVFASIYNNRDHRKITVIDGKIAFTGGLNLADEYINEYERFGVWKDTAIRVEGEAVDNFTLMFLSTYNINLKTSEEFSSYLNNYDVVEENGVIAPYADGPKPFYDDYIAENVYLNMINSASKYIWITTPYLICDSRILEALKTAAMRGVDVRIVMPHVPDKKVVFMISRSNYKSLQSKGVKIYEFKPGFMHAKQFICDDVEAIVGTINLDYRSLIHHFENGILMFKTDVIKDIKIDFENTFKECISMENYRQGKLATLLCCLLEIVRPLL